MVTSNNWSTTGWVLGPVLFLIYIYIYIYIYNNIDDVVSSKILKFADDTKLYRAVTDQDDIEILQSDLVNLCHWSKDWLMLFNTDKCKHYISKWKFKWVIQYGRPLESVYEECDLGIMITKDLKFSN